MIAVWSFTPVLIGVSAVVTGLNVWLFRTQRVRRASDVRAIEILGESVARALEGDMHRLASIEVCNVKTGESYTVKVETMSDAVERILREDDGL